jgi:hypothetical protein
MKQQPLDVGNANVENLQIATGPRAFASIQGRIVIEDGSPEALNFDLTRVQVRLVREPNLAVLPPPPPPPPGGIPNGLVAANGSFAFNFMPPGDYRLGLTGVPSNLYLKSARAGDTDLLNDVLLVNQQPAGPIEIVLSGQTGVVHGIALDERQRPAANVTVVLVPEGGQRKRFDLYRNTMTDASGTFEIHGVPEGDYKVFAWEDVEFSAWLSSDFLQPHEARGRRLRVQAGSRQSVDAIIIPVVR